MTSTQVRRLFGKYISEHKKSAEDAMPGWGLGDSCFVDELEEIRDAIISKLEREMNLGSTTS